ncbi:MAG TPA: ATP-dependent Clp protease ATP-binding subunit [Bacteroidales bacterium]|nr:ATP-dependent Clp protease ATP-binding subunit [Bacteroidales bacterium]
MVRLSAGANLAWVIAVSETSQAKYQYIEKEQVLIGICSLEKAVAPGTLKDVDPSTIQALRSENNAINDLLKSLNLDQASMRRALRDRVGQGNYTHTEKTIHRSEACKECFNRADTLAKKRGSEEVNCLDLFAAIVEKPGSPIDKILKLNVNTENNEKGAVSKKEPEATNANEKSKTEFLEIYGTDLTKLAEEKKLEPLIGRRDELLQVIRTLSREQKSNPLIIGEAGVGKTAIVRGLAQRIADKNITPALREKRLIELNMVSLVAGSKYRGEFEERLTKLIQEIKENPEIIVFIDEIHTIVGAGSVQGGLDASNILKPALARGELSVIGATTIAEYRKYFEKDAALERRFQPITVVEPSIDDSILILNGLKKRSEEHHKIKITDPAIKAAVELSVKYLPDRRLPDKALDLLDEACSRKKVPQLSMVGDFEENFGTVVYEDIAEVVEKWTGIPVLTKENEKERLLKMEDLLKERVIGQDDAIRKIAKKIRIARSGLQDPDRPLGVFLFLGPTGIGKTETAKALSSFLFGSEDAMTRLDMSEYMEKHSVSKLVGAPPGYVGYDEEGQLTGALRRKPYSVVLLDEIEKAHPEVFDIFLQVFDAGRLTDTKGRTADAKNAIFIMTSNLQLSDNVYERAYGIDGDNEAGTQRILKDLTRIFRPEFVNRIDEIIVFNHLKQDDIQKIAEIMVGKIKSRMSKKGMDLKVEGDVIGYISKEGYDENFGARPLRRAIERLLEEPLSEDVIRGELKDGDKIVVKMVEGKISIERKGKDVT